VTMSTKEEKLELVGRLSRRIGQTIEQAASAHAFMRTSTWAHLDEATRKAYGTDVSNLEFKLWALLRDRVSLEQELQEVSE